MNAIVGSSQNLKVEIEGTSIRIKALLQVAVTILIIGISTSYLIVSNNLTKEKAALAARAILVADLQSNALATPIWEFEIDSVQTLTEALSNDPAFQSAWVINAKDIEVATFGEKKKISDVEYSSSEILYEEDGEVTKVGTLHLQLTNKFITEYRNEQIIAAIVATTIFLFIILSSIYLSLRMIINPMMSMTDAMRELASDNLEVEVPAKNRTDEVGLMASAVQVFKDNALNMRQMQEDRAQEAKDQAEARKVETDNVINTFRDKVGTSIDLFHRSSIEMKDIAEAMSKFVQDAENNALEIATASTSASENVESIAGASTELSCSIQEISQQASKSSRQASDAVSQAKEASREVEGLVLSAEKIGVVVSLINDIADQTNLLALNATIEAARAGDAGKGFAVVASEVKNLATQTGNATQEISAQISDIQNRTNLAVEAIRTIESSITELNEGATSIAASVEQQGSATSEIASNIERASTGTTDVTIKISAIAESVSATGKSSANVLQSAVVLENHSKTVQSSVDEFLTYIREA